MALPRYDVTVFDNVPRLVGGAIVYVYTEPTTPNPITSSNWNASLTGLSTLYQDQAGSIPLSNPFTVDNNGSGAFYAAAGSYTVVATGGTLAGPSVKINQSLIVSAGGGVLIQVNGVNSSNQGLLNLIAGSNITINNSAGNITIAGTAAPITFKINGSNASSQTTQNLQNGTGISIVDAGSGNVTINATGSTVVQVNGTPAITQSPINFVNSSTVTFSNPSAGNITAVSAYPTFQTNSVSTSDQSGLNFVDTAGISWSNPSGNIVEATLNNPGSVAFVSLQITSAQLKTLRATPLLILAAAGSNEQYKLVNATFEFEPVTTPYATVGKNDLAIYVDTTKATLFKGDSQGLIDQTAKTYEDAYALVPISVAVTVTPSITFPNPVVLPFNAATQSAPISGQSLTASLPYSGAYRVSWYAVATQAATTSSTLGGTKGFQLHYTDVDTNAAAVTPQAGAPSAGVNQAYSQTNQGNTVGTNAEGVIFINAKTGTALTFDFDYTSVGGTALQYAIHVRVEYIDQASSVSTPASATTSYSKFFTTDALSTNQAIFIANVSGAEYTTGDGTLTVNVWYELLSTV